MELGVGLIGTGHIGTPVGLRLLDAGLLRGVFDVDRSRADSFAGRTLVAHSPQELVARADIILTLLPTGAAMEALFMSAPSLLDSWSEGQVLLDMGTTAPNLSRELEGRVIDVAGRYLEAPVSGGTSAALAGSLTIVAAGDEAVFSDIRPVLDVLGGELFFVGAAGAAQTLKLANNLLLAVQTVAVGEAWGLVTSAAIEPELAHRVLSMCSGDSRVLRTRVPEPGLVSGSPPSDGYLPGFAVRLMMKDIQLVKRLAEESGSLLPTLTAAEQQYAAAIGRGLAESDISIVAREVGETGASVSNEA